MRRVTRNFVLLLVAVLVALLALGALPSLLGSGDPYYLTADPVEENGSDGANAANASAPVNGSALSERQFPYTREALGNGSSKPYRAGPWGLKEGFTHSPFDEFEALSRDYPNATETVGNDTRVYLTHNGTSYGVQITQTPGSVGGSGDGVLVTHNGTLYRIAVRQRV